MLSGQSLWVQVPFRVIYIAGQLDAVHILIIGVLPLFGDGFIPHDLHHTGIRLIPKRYP